jgi:hypothetical protein
MNVTFLFFGTCLQTVYADITTGLIGHWAFEEGNGVTTADLSGNGNTGTLTNSPSWVSGQIGNYALNFDGVDDAVSTASDFISTTDGTYSAWIYARSEGKNLLGFIVTNGAASQFGFGLCAPRTIGFTSNNSTNDACGVSGSISYNTWYFVTATRNASGVANLYVNGVLSGVADQNSGTPQAGSTNVHIGNSIFSSRSWDGYIDNVRIYNRVLSASDVLELYNSFDTNPPVISSVSYSTTNTTATITWTTNENSTSVVNYGATSSYGTASTSASSVTSHSVTLTGLTHSTPYHFQVLSTDASGNNSVSTDYTFITAPPTSHYIRAGATGNNDGSSWANAWNSFSAVTWTRGDVYYVAGGTYTENVTISVAESNTAQIILKKANITDNSGDTGWNSSYATEKTIIIGTLTISNSYVSVDGITGSDNLNHGIKVHYTGCDGVFNGTSIVTLGSGKSSIYLNHVEIEGCGYGSYDSTDGFYQNNSVPANDIQVRYSYIHNVSRNGITIGNNQGTAFTDGRMGFLFENNRLERTGGCTYPDWHGQGVQIYGGTDNYIVFRNNKFIDITGTGYIAFLGGSTHSNIRIYNNILYATDRTTYSVSPGVITFLDSSVSVNNVLIYNNTFYNLELAAVTNWAASGSGNELKNNLWANSRFTYGQTGFIVGYNSYYSNTGNVPVGEVGQQNELSNPLVNAVGGDFRLVSGAKAIGNAQDLSSVFATDFSGNIRNSWDIGAHEHVSTHTVGGTISNLSGTIVLQNNTGDNKSISTNGSFTFSTPISNLSNYFVTILTQPTNQTCTVSNGSGTVYSANVTNITINCTTSSVSTSPSSSGGGGSSVGSVTQSPGTTKTISTQGTTTITSLQNQIAQLTLQLNTLVPQTKTANYTFTRNLSINMKGDDVLNLQKFLNSKGFTISTTGVGSKGKETTTFGKLTYKALQKFQKSAGLPATGFFGPMTRGYINKK